MQYQPNNTRKMKGIFICASPTHTHILTCICYYKPPCGWYILIHFPIRSSRWHCISVFRAKFNLFAEYSTRSNPLPWCFVLHSSVRWLYFDIHCFLGLVPLFQLSHKPVCSVTFEGYLRLKSNRLDREETTRFDETLQKFFEDAIRMH